MCKAAQHPSLVARVLPGPWPEWHPGVCEEGLGVISVTQGEQLHPRGDQWLLHAASSPLLGWRPLHAHPGCVAQLPRLQGKAASEDPGICKGPSVLGRKSPASDHRQISPTDRKCTRIATWDEARNNVYWWRSPGGPTGIPLDEDYTIPIDGVWPVNQGAKREWSHSRTHRAWAWGSFLVAYGEGWLKTSTTTRQFVNWQLQPWRWSQSQKSPSVSDHHPHQHLWKLHNPCVRITCLGW